MRGGFGVVMREIKYIVARLGEALTSIVKLQVSARGSTTEKDVVEHIKIGAGLM